MDNEGGGGAYAVSAGPRARRALGVVTAVVTAALVAGCGGASPPPSASLTVRGIELPVFEKSCPLKPGASSVVPVNVVRTAIVANVCIGGEGPFPFLVDTGGATTLLDSSLAARLHLDLVDGPRTVRSFTCQRQISFAALQRWSVGNTALLPQTVEVGGVRSPAFPNLGGVLGSSTLSGFGAVRIDYRQQILTLGPQEAPLVSNVAGRSGPPSVPTSLTEGTSFASPMPVKVVSERLSPDHLRLIGVRPTVDLAFGPTRLTLTLDSGAGATNLAPSVVKKLGLAPAGPPGAAYAGLDCPVDVNHYTMGPAMLGKVQLRPQTVGSNFIPPGTVGVLGSGTLIDYSPVLVDYVDGELFLGHGPQAQAASPAGPISSG
ncbi:MAG TPA: retropepsin-like aspartic protease [Acidimicrobiales bacterium]|nr:retropepsin-like aspartic protease [Acidimicrobiales bacterium]